MVILIGLKKKAGLRALFAEQEKIRNCSLHHKMANEITDYNCQEKGQDAGWISL